MFGTGSHAVDERFQDRMRRERADSILREASALASEQGWAALRMEDVAHRTGIAKGTIYLDFKDKDELVAAAVRRSMGEILDGMRSAAEGASDDERLEVSLRVLARLPLERPDLVSLIRFTQNDPHAPEGALEDVERYLKRLIRIEQLNGRVENSADPEFVAQSVVAAITLPAWNRLAKRGSSGVLLRLVFTTEPSEPHLPPIPTSSAGYPSENSDSTVG
jgi:AcrR family transcriptional regulator